MFEEDANEGPLPRLQLFSLPVDRRLDQRRRADFLRRQLAQLHLPLASAAPDLFDDHVRQRHAAVPEVIKLALHPGDALCRAVLPDHLVVARPAFSGLVQAAHERRIRTVRRADYASLSVQERGFGSGDHANLDVPLSQKVIEPLVARAMQQGVQLGIRVVPSFE